MATEHSPEVRRNLSQKSTEDLLAIWRSGDRSQSAGETFEIIKEILNERGVEAPTQRTIPESVPEPGPYRAVTVVDIILVAIFGAIVVVLGMLLALVTGLLSALLM